MFEIASSAKYSIANDNAMKSIVVKKTDFQQFSK